MRGNRETSCIITVPARAVVATLPLVNALTSTQEHRQTQVHTHACTTCPPDTVKQTAEQYLVVSYWAQGSNLYGRSWKTFPSLGPLNTDSVVLSGTLVVLYCSLLVALGTAPKHTQHTTSIPFSQSVYVDQYSEWGKYSLWSLFLWMFSSRSSPDFIE